MIRILSAEPFDYGAQINVRALVDGQPRRFVVRDGVAACAEGMILRDDGDGPRAHLTR